MYRVGNPVFLTTNLLKNKTHGLAKVKNTLKDVKDRNTQFEKFKSITTECENAGIQVFLA